MKQIITFLSLTLFLATPLWAEVKIQGKITVPPGAKAEGINVVLIEQNPQKAPQGPIAMATTNAAGEYQLILPEADPDSRYVVGARLGNDRIGSEPIQIVPGQIKVDQNLAFEASQAAPMLKGNFRVQGQIKVLGDQGLQDAEVILVQFNPETQQQAQIGQAKPDAQGRYSFALAEVGASFRYQVVGRVGRQFVGSSPFQLSKAQSSISKEIVVPKLSKATEQLQWYKNAVIVELMEDYLQITEFVIFGNETEATIDSYDRPYVKKLPLAADLFQAEPMFGQEVNHLNGNVMVRMLAPTGQGQLVYSYRLPLSSTSVEMELSLFPGTQEIEIITTNETLETNFLGVSEEVTSQARRHQEEAVFSKKVLLASPRDSITLEIGGLPMPQRYLVYPATLLLILLLSGLFWYLKVRPQKAEPA